jgi:hypothetical protein
MWLGALQTEALLPDKRYGRPWSSPKGSNSDLPSPTQEYSRFANL